MASTRKQRAQWRKDYAARVKKRGARRRLRVQWREAQARRSATLGVKLERELAQGSKHVARAEKLTGDIALVAQIAATTKK